MRGNTFVEVMDFEFPPLSELSAIKDPNELRNQSLSGVKYFECVYFDFMLKNGKSSSLNASRQPDKTIELGSTEKRIARIDQRYDGTYLCELVFYSEDG